jgi:hypothetical protein
MGNREGHSCCHTHASPDLKLQLNFTKTLSCRADTYFGRYLDFYIAAARIRALTAAHRIMPTSPRCRSAWQPNPADAKEEILFRQPRPAHMSCDPQTILAFATTAVSELSFVNCNRFLRN